MFIRIMITLFTLYAMAVYPKDDSRYYKKSITWQESFSNSIKAFHAVWDNLKIILHDESIIKLGDWYSVGGFAGERDELHKMEFGPEKNPGLDQVYTGEKKWVIRSSKLRGLPVTAFSSRPCTWLRYSSATDSSIWMVMD